MGPNPQKIGCIDSILKQILDWFREPIDKRINFGVIYHHEPDVTGKSKVFNEISQIFLNKIGHVYGPISAEMNRTLKECDDYIGQLLEIIDNDEYLKTNLNVIITSDHGMYEIKKNHTIKLEEYVDTSLFSVYGSRSFVNDLL